MTKKIGIVMDPIDSITPEKDTGFAMMLEAQARGWSVFYMEPQDLFLDSGKAKAKTYTLKLHDNNDHWFNVLSEQTIDLAELDMILMRVDPPVDFNYIYATQVLELAERNGVRVINKPQSLRDANEKLFTAYFPDLCAPNLVSSNATLIRAFYLEHKDIILKPLDGMGGDGVFRVRENDPNINAIIETLTDHGFTPIMAQRFIPEITQGDKRILLINGEPIPFTYARIAAKGETRANLAAGGTGVAQPLTENDRKICETVGPVLKEKGLVFVGLDVIGDYLTEINVTAPTCVRQLDKACDLNICSLLFDAVI